MTSQSKNIDIKMKIKIIKVQNRKRGLKNLWVKWSKENGEKKKETKDENEFVKFTCVKENSKQNRRRVHKNTKLT